MTGSTNADFSSFSTDYCGLTSSSTSCSGLLSLPHKLVPIVHNWLDKGEHISYAEPIRYFLSNIWIRTLKDPVGTWWTLELKVYIKSELDWSNHLQQFLALIIKHGESIERKGKKGRGSGREGERERMEVICGSTWSGRSSLSPWLPGLGPEFCFPFGCLKS